MIVPPQERQEALDWVKVHSAGCTHLQLVLRAGIMLAMAEYFFKDDSITCGTQVAALMMEDLNGPSIRH